MRGVVEFLLDNVIVLGDKCYCLVNSVIQLVNCCDPAGRFFAVTFWKGVEV